MDGSSADPFLRLAVSGNPTSQQTSPSGGGASVVAEGLWSVDVCERLLPKEWLKPWPVTGSSSGPENTRDPRAFSLTEELRAPPPTPDARW